MNKLQTIREACIKANPEIVELKFGCEIFVEQWEHSATMCTFEGLTQLSGARNMTLYHEGRLHYVGSNEKGKIIGRPICLADIIFMMQQNDNVKLDDKITLVQKHGLYRWDVSDDNLENQSKECIDFIFNLLPTK